MPALRLRGSETRRRCFGHVVLFMAVAVRDFRLAAFGRPHPKGRAGIGQEGLGLFLSNGIIVYGAGDHFLLGGAVNNDAVG